MSLELEETVARRKVFEKGKNTSEKQLSKLTASTSSTAGPQSDNNVLEECYYVRLLLNKISYKLKLCELEMHEDHLKQKIKEIDEEMEAEMISLPKALSNLPRRLQQHPPPQTYTTYKNRDDTLQCPVPKPRKPKIRPQSSKTMTMVNYQGKHKTLPDSQSLSCPPNNSSPIFEPLPRPTPKPRKLRTRTLPSLSRENSVEPKIRPQSSKTMTMVNYQGKHKTLPDSQSLSCPPNNSSPIFEPLRRPTPKPRKLRTRTLPSLSRENSVELPNTPLQSRKSPENLPQISQTSSGQHLQPRTSIPYPRRQKPAVPPRRFQPKPTSQ